MENDEVLTLTTDIFEFIGNEKCTHLPPQRRRIHLQASDNNCGNISLITANLLEHTELYLTIDLNSKHQAQTLGAIVILEKNSCAMPNLAEVNLTLKYYKENHSCDITVPVGITVSEFKESCTFAPQKEIKDCHVAFKSENDKLFLIKDTEVISSCIAQAKEILLLSMGEQHPQKKTDSESHRSTDQFAWFDNLADEIKNKRLTPGIASLLAPCFGQFWESVFYCLGFTTEIVDLEMENCKHNALRAATKLLMKWEHKVTKDATLKSLMERMIRVHKYGCTVINWKSVQEIMTNHV